jgi:hypothetical protein
MIGGGGGGGKDRAGGGGSGALILSIGNILSGTYTIRVGNGSLGATTGVNPVNGYDCEIVNSVGTTIFRAKGGGGGQSLNVENAPDGGSGGGKSSQFPALGGNVVSTNIVSGITTGPVITTTYGVYGNIGGRNITSFTGGNLDAMDGAGGGGIGQGGSTSGSLVQVDSQFVANNGGNGGDGLYFATINGVVYNFKNYFNVNGIQDGTTGNFFIGGGGGGGDNNGGVAGIGGKGGGGKGGESGVVGSPASGFGSGGGGGGGGNNNGGNGSAGIVAIKFKTIVNAGIPEGNPITHKTLNFTYSTTPPNTYTLSVQAGTSIQVNNQPAQYLSGNYTISVGATQSSVLISGFSPIGQTDPYPLQNGSTISIRYSMLQRITSIVNYKKDGLIKYVPASGINPTTGTWQILEIDTQPLTQFAGNLPANRLDNIDMSKVATGNLDWSRIASQPALSSLSGNLPLSRTDGNLPASRLDNIDMGKVSSGNLNYNRIDNFYLGINERFARTIYAYENIVNGGVWTNKFRIGTNLHLNQYNQAYNYYQYFLSMSPNNVADRHKYWFGVVKMSVLVGTDPTPITRSSSILSNSSLDFEIRETNSTDGVWWLNIWVYTSAYCESIILIMR